jgi:hypothetical protein
MKIDHKTGNVVAENLLIQGFPMEQLDVQASTDIEELEVKPPLNFAQKEFNLAAKLSELKFPLEKYPEIDFDNLPPVRLHRSNSI